MNENVIYFQSRETHEVMNWECEEGNIPGDWWVVHGEDGV